MTGMCQEFRPQAGLLPLTIYLAAPRGFCAGVDRAIQIVELALAKYGAPVYVRHEIVHNRYVVEIPEGQGRRLRRGTGRNPGYRRAGDLFRPWRAEIGAGGGRRRATLLSSTPPARSSPRSISRPSATTTRAARSLLIGHAGHPEVVGTMGQLPEGAVHLIETVADARAFTPKRRGQARLHHADHALRGRHRARSSSVLQERFPRIVGPRKEDICYATTNRQDAVKRIAPRMRLADRRRRAQQLQFAAPRRGGASAPAARAPC